MLNVIYKEKSSIFDNLAVLNPTQSSNSCLALCFSVCRSTHARYKNSLEKSSFYGIRTAFISKAIVSLKWKGMNNEIMYKMTNLSL